MSRTGPGRSTIVPAYMPEDTHGGRSTVMACHPVSGRFNHMISHEHAQYITYLLVDSSSILMT
jgi:hypothetical protein